MIVQGIANKAIVLINTNIQFPSVSQECQWLRVMLQSIVRNLTDATMSL